MRTTITIPDELAAAAKEMTGKSRLSEALVDILADKLRIQKQLAALEFFANNKSDVTYKQIKAARSKRKWSA